MTIMPLELSARTKSFSPSPTRAIDARARELAASGKDIIFFTLGEPDFPTPSNIKRAAITAIKEDFTKYTHFAGIPELREAICAKLQRDHSLHYGPEEIVVTSGAINALYAVFQCLLNAGDEVIIPQPIWPVFAEQVKAAGGMPRFVQCSEDNLFEPTAEIIAAAVTKNTKAIIINSPCNPTGAMTSRKNVAKIAQLASERGIWIVSDEVYEKLSFDAKPVSPAGYSKENVIVVNAVSKAFSMTGWRVGYAAGPRDLINSIASLQSISLGNVNSVAQKAALAALNGSQGSVAKMKREFRARRDLTVKLLNEIDGVSCRAAPGAFYAFPNVSKLKGKTTPDGKVLETSFDICNFFLENAGVALIPGAPFGSDDHLRLSFATSQETIKEGIARMCKVASELK